MTINRNRVIAYGFIFCVILISTFVIWPASELKTGDANIPVSLCPGSNLEQIIDGTSCMVYLDEPQKFYLGGWRYLEQIYGFSPTISNDKEQFPLLYATLSSVALAAIVIVLILLMEKIVYRKTKLRLRKPTSREIITLLIIFTVFVFIVSQYMLHKADNTKPYADTGCDPVTGLC